MEKVSIDQVWQNDSPSSYIYISLFYRRKEIPERQKSTIKNLHRQTIKEKT